MILSLNQIDRETLLVILNYRIPLNWISEESQHNNLALLVLTLLVRQRLENLGTNRKLGLIH